ncbi:hypothetical protein Ndes2526B_g07084 [Nannochloris sp. 'desiccata']
MSTSDQQLIPNSFVFPEFWSYPPYFTLQPIPESQEKQKELWRGLILSYCRHYRIFQINVDDAAAQQTLPFANPAIKRHLNRDAKLVFLEDLAAHSRGQWLDGKTRSNFLVLWKTLNEWADSLYTWAVANGLKDSVVTVDEVQRGEAVVGTELEGMPRVVLEKALKVLETQGKAKLFSGSTPDEEGVKFF